MNIEKPLREKIEQFKSVLFEAGDGLLKAGKIVCEIVDSHPEGLDAICKLCPEFSPEFIKRFEDIGRLKIHPQLMFTGGPGVERLRKLPYSLQEKHLIEPLPLVILKEKGGVEILQVDVRNLDAAQAGQIFTQTGIRSEAEQRAWIESRRMKAIAPPASAGLPYRVQGKKIIFMEPCTLTTEELAKILAEAI